MIRSSYFLSGYTVTYGLVKTSTLYIPYLLRKATRKGRERERQGTRQTRNKRIKKSQMVLMKVVGKISVQSNVAFKWIDTEVKNNTFARCKRGGSRKGMRKGNITSHEFFQS